MASKTNNKPINIMANYGYYWLSTHRGLPGRVAPLGGPDLLPRLEAALPRGSKQRVIVQGRGHGGQALEDGGDHGGDEDLGTGEIPGGMVDDGGWWMDDLVVIRALLAKNLRFWLTWILIYIYNLEVLANFTFLKLERVIYSIISIIGTLRREW